MVNADKLQQKDSKTAYVAAKDLNIGGMPKLWVDEIETDMFKGMLSVFPYFLILIKNGGEIMELFLWVLNYNKSNLYNIGTLQVIIRQKILIHMLVPARA